MKKGPPKECDKIERQKWKIVFISEMLKNYCHVGLACSLAGVSRETAYRERRTDKVFRRAWNDAKKHVISNLEKAAFKRATKGTRNPVYQNGKLVGYKKEYSDSLVMPLLKAHKKKYKDGSDSTGVTIVPVPAQIVLRDDHENEKA